MATKLAMLRAMDLKTLLTTLAVLGSGASLVACDKGKAEEDKSEDAAKTDADAENKGGEDAKEVSAAEGDADKGGEKAKGEASCGEGSCGEGTCGGEKGGEDEAPKGDSNLAAPSNADKEAVPPKGSAEVEQAEDEDES